MNRTIAKRATWKHPDRPERVFLLEQIERACFRWIEPLTNKRWDGVDYLDIGTAVKAMRVCIESDPDCIGVDLTIFDAIPSPEMRAARSIRKAMNRTWENDGQEQRFAEIIAAETNLSPLLQSFSELIAFIMTRRPALSFGLALATMPPPIIANINRAIAATGQQPGRDLTLDGLLYTAIENLSKSTGQDLSNLLKPLKEPVSTVVQARAMPKTEGPVQ